MRLDDQVRPMVAVQALRPGQRVTTDQRRRIGELFYETNDARDAATRLAPSQFAFERARRASDAA
jgi:hypothetical protein